VALSRLRESDLSRFAFVMGFSTPMEEAVMIETTGVVHFTIPASDLDPGNERFVHHAFSVTHEKYEESRAFIEEKGVHIIHEEERHDGVFRGKQAHFHDPDRNVIEIIALDGLGP
jgi:catechol 2,3-dioxygenase-like lactoylglutathione lyase family enzyme